MKTIGMALFLASSAAAQPLEAVRFSADAAFLRVPSNLPAAQEQPLLKFLDVRPMSAGEALGAVIARVSLPSILSSNRHILTRMLGSRQLDLGVASNAAFSQGFFTFSDQTTTTLAPSGDIDRLRGSGVDVRIDADTAYNVKLVINIFDPVRGSTLKMTPIQGTSGPKHAVKTGALLDATRARAFVFSVSGRELWLSYDADVLPDGSGFADTRSLLFIKEDGRSSKAWHVAESQLPVDAAVAIGLDEIKLNLTRTAAGELIIRQ